MNITSYDKGQNNVNTLKRQEKEKKILKNHSNSQEVNLPSNNCEDLEIQKMSAPSKKIFANCFLKPILEDRQNSSPESSCKRNGLTCFSCTQDLPSFCVKPNISIANSSTYPISFLPVSSYPTLNVEGNSIFPLSIQNLATVTIPIQTSPICIPVQSFHYNHQIVPLSTFYHLAHILVNNATNKPMLIDNNTSLFNVLPQDNLQNIGFIPNQPSPLNNSVFAVSDKPVTIILNQHSLTVQPREQITLQIHHHTNIYCPNSNNNFFTVDAMNVNKL